MNETMQEIFKRVDALAAKLGMVGQQLYHALRVQVVIEGWENLGFTVFWLALTVVMTKLSWKAYEKGKEEVYDSTGWFTVMVLAGVGALICFAVALAYLGWTFEYLLNPDYQIFRMFVK